MKKKNLNLRVYQVFVGPIQCHGIRYIALEFLFVNRSPLHFNHLWISHIVFWAINFWNPLHYLLDEGWYFLRWRTMAPPFGAKSWQRWPWLCVHRPHLPLIHPILPPISFQPPHRPSYQPHWGHSSTREAFLPPWLEGKVHDDEAFVLIVVEPWVCVQRPQVPPTRKVWLPTVLMILTHRPNDPQVSISDADDLIVVVALWHNTVSVKITTKENMNAFCGWSLISRHEKKFIALLKMQRACQRGHPIVRFWRAFIGTVHYKIIIV